MDDKEVRLRLLGMVIPTASKVGLTDPEQLIETASKLENYVCDKGVEKQTEIVDTVETKPSRKRGRNRVE